MFVEISYAILLLFTLECFLSRSPKVSRHVTHVTTSYLNIFVVGVCVMGDVQGGLFGVFVRREVGGMGYKLIWRILFYRTGKMKRCS